MADKPTAQFLIVAVVETDHPELVEHSNGAMGGYIERLIATDDRISRVALIMEDMPQKRVLGFQDGHGFFSVLNDQDTKDS